VPVRQIDDYLSRERMQFSRRYLETLKTASSMKSLLEEDAPAFRRAGARVPACGNCNYNMSGLACTVSAGPLLRDGRQQGQFERQPGVGLRAGREHRRKAFFIWLNLNELGRFGSFKMRNREAAIMGHSHGQRGVTLMGLIILLFILIFVALLGFKLIPAYIDFYTAKKAVNAIARERQGATVAEIRRSFDNRAAIDDIKVRASDLEITKQGNEGGESGSRTARKCRCSPYRHLHRLRGQLAGPVDRLVPARGSRKSGLATDLQPSSCCSRR